MSNTKDRSKEFYGMKAEIREDGLCYFEDGTVIDPNQFIEDEEDSCDIESKFNDFEKRIRRLEEDLTRCLDAVDARLCLIEGVIELCQLCKEKEAFNYTAEVMSHVNSPTNKKLKPRNNKKSQ